MPIITASCCAHLDSSNAICFVFNLGKESIFGKIVFFIRKKPDMKLVMVEVEPGRRGTDGKLSLGPVYRHQASKNGFPDPDKEIFTDWDIFSVAVNKYPNNQMLGWRTIKNGQVGPYVWKTYNHVYEEVLLIVSALQASGVKPGCRIGIYGANCPEWIMAMEACNGNSLISVPLYDTLGPTAVDYIINHAEIDIVFVQDKKMKEILNPDCESAGRLKKIISFSCFSMEERQRAEQMGIETYSWEEFLKLGKENPAQVDPPKGSDICTIMYTSGSTGDPKGVVIKHEAVVAFVRGLNVELDHYEEKMTEDDVYLSFLPLAHIFDIVLEKYFFHKGASVGYYHGDLNALLDDITELKPTFLAGVPRVFERIYQGINKTVSQLNPFRRWAFDTLYRHKLNWMNKGYKQNDASRLADLLAFRKVKSKLGGRIRLIVSGGAPLSREVEVFLRVTCCCLIIQGYGLTESCGPAIIVQPDDMSMVDTIGIVSVNFELRLMEIPEMGYNPLDEVPRGEICLRGKAMFSEYYKNSELTREAMVDGWFQTGDVGEILPNGVVKIIDRKKNLIKLSQGEYIALEHLENIYGTVPVVEDIWVYGDSFRSKLVAVVVVSEEKVKQWGKENEEKGSVEELCSVPLLEEYVLRELKSTGDREKIRGFEQIKGVILEHQPFDMERDLITATLKKKRNKLLSYYKSRIDQLYDNLK